MKSKLLTSVIASVMTMGVAFSTAAYEENMASEEHTNSLKQVARQHLPDEFEQTLTKPARASNLAVEPIRKVSKQAPVVMDAQIDLKVGVTDVTLHRQMVGQSDVPMNFAYTDRMKVESQNVSSSSTTMTSFMFEITPHDSGLYFVDFDYAESTPHLPVTIPEGSSIASSFATDSDSLRQGSSFVTIPLGERTCVWAIVDKSTKERLEEICVLLEEI